MCGRDTSAPELQQTRLYFKFISPYTALASSLIWDWHNQRHGADPAVVHAEFSTEYYIFRSKHLFKTAYNNCAKCTIAEEAAKPSHSEAGPLPAFRIAHLTAVQKNKPLELFDFTMLDLFGPITTYAGNLSLVEKLKLTRASKGLYPLINTLKFGWSYFSTLHILA